MVKIKNKFKDGSELTYTIKTSKGYLVPEYANRYVNNPSIKSITVQNYPLKSNPVIDWLNDRPKVWIWKDREILV